MVTRKALPGFGYHRKLKPLSRLFAVAVPGKQNSFCHETNLKLCVILCI